VDISRTAQSLSLFANFELESGYFSQYRDYATGWTTEVRFPAGATKENFSLRHASRSTLGPTEPVIQWVLGALSLDVEWAGREADHSIQLSAKVKDAWRCLVKHMGKFTFIIIIIHNGSGSHPASYPMGTRSCFPGDKAAGS
jgi:hypothetical protein